MINVVLFVHVVISVVLVITILLQRSSSDGFSSGAGAGGLGIVSAKAASTFLRRSTAVLAVVFMLNALLLANLYSRKTSSLSDRIQSERQKEVNNEKSSLPVAQ